MRVTVLWIGIGLTGLPGVTAAQRIANPDWSRPAPAFAAPLRTPALVRRGNHGLEGAIVGGIGLGLVSFLIADRLCGIRAVPVSGGSSSGGCSGEAAFTAAGVALGAGLGYWIGTGFPKYVEEP